MKPFNEESAYLWATGRCASRECCLQDLAKKFREGDLSEDAIERLSDRLVDEQYVDEARYARAYAHDKLEYDHWGRIKITQALRLKGISRKDISQAFDEVIEPEHYAEILREILQAKLRSLSFDADDREEAYKAVQKLVRFAASRGFESDLIFRQIDELT